MSNLNCTLLKCGATVLRDCSQVQFPLCPVTIYPHTLPSQPTEKIMQPSSRIHAALKNSLFFFFLSPIKQNKQPKCCTCFLLSFLHLQSFLPQLRQIIRRICKRRYRHFSEDLKPSQVNSSHMPTEFSSFDLDAPEPVSDVFDFSLYSLSTVSFLGGGI